MHGRRMQRMGLCQRRPCLPRDAPNHSTHTMGGFLSMHVCVYVCVYVCMYVSVHVCMYLRTYECIYLYTYICVCVNACVCIHVYVVHMCGCILRVCVCMYARECVCALVCLPFLSLRSGGSIHRTHAKRFHAARQ